MVPAKKAQLDYTIDIADETQPTGRLLILLFRAFETTLIERLDKQGVTDISMSDLNVIRHLDPCGSQISAIAQSAGLSKQAIGRTVADLEKKGIVRTIADPSDRRGKLVQFTHKGARLVATAIEIIKKMETRYKKIMGADEYNKTRQSLILLIKSHAENKV